MFKANLLYMVRPENRLTVTSSVMQIITLYDIIEHMINKKSYVYYRDKWVDLVWDKDNLRGNLVHRYDQHSHIGHCRVCILDGNHRRRRIDCYRSHGG